LCRPACDGPIRGLSHMCRADRAARIRRQLCRFGQAAHPVAAAWTPNGPSAGGRGACRQRVHATPCRRRAAQLTAPSLDRTPSGHRGRAEGAVSELRNDATADVELSHDVACGQGHHPAPLAGTGAGRRHSRAATFRADTLARSPCGRSPPVQTMKAPCASRGAMAPSKATSIASKRCDGKCTGAPASNSCAFACCPRRRHPGNERLVVSSRCDAPSIDKRHRPPMRPS
jgi:hypothetical protein